jgi:hypothetical protein
MTGIRKRSTDPRVDQKRLQELKNWDNATREVRRDMRARGTKGDAMLNALKKARGR